MRTQFFLDVAIDFQREAAQEASSSRACLYAAEHSLAREFWLKRAAAYQELSRASYRAARVSMGLESYGGDDG